MAPGATTYRCRAREWERDSDDDDDDAWALAFEGVNLPAYANGAAPCQQGAEAVTLRQAAELGVRELSTL